MNLLELWHPNGTAPRVMVLGRANIGVLTPKLSVDATEPADLIIMAPTKAEYRRQSALHAYIQTVAHRLVPDGIAYILVPARLRLRMQRLMCQHGFSLHTALVHLPNWTSGTCLVPLTARLARSVVLGLLPGQRWRHVLARLVLQLPGGISLLRTSLPHVGLLFTRSGARPPLAWLYDDYPTGSAAIMTSWRGLNSTVRVYSLPASTDVMPSIAKVSGAERDYRQITAAAQLKQMGRNAQLAGVQVPQVVYVTALGKRPVVLEQLIVGDVVAGMLPRNPNLLPDIMDHLTTWLVAWNQRTHAVQPLRQADVEQLLLEPAHVIMPHVAEHGLYLAWLKQRVATMIGQPVPFVAAHQDLTMWNVLMDRKQRVTVVDWEAANNHALPLVDFWYAMVDAVAATQHYADRVDAFDACFSPGGSYRQLVNNFQRRFCYVLALPQPLVELAFHACWLHHAANEQRAPYNMTRRPFLNIVQRLATDARTMYGAHWNA